MEDYTLITAARRGETKAFGTLIEKHQQALVASAWQLTHNRESAEDLAQEACIEAYQKLHLLKKVNSFRPWLFAILRNKCRDYLRQRCPWNLRGIVFDTAGNVYTVSSEFKVLKYSPAGRQLGCFQVICAYSIANDPAGHLYIACLCDKGVCKVTENGGILVKNLLATPPFVKYLLEKSPFDGIHTCAAVTIGADGTIYVMDLVQKDKNAKKFDRCTVRMLKPVL